VRLDHVLGGVDGLDRLGDPAAVDVRDVTHDSRLAVAGSLYCCISGAVVDGHDYAAAAVDAGAVALLCERLVDVDVAQVRVAATRPAMAVAAANFWDAPSRKLLVAGVTGTNGKTTTTYLLQSVLAAHGWPTGVIGTLSGARTTPESTELQRQLARLVAEGHEAVAMEVSSHALAQHRVEATWFAVAGFTNLSQDHLDFHGDMESYFGAKAALFSPGVTALGAVNADDAFGRRLLAEAAVPLVPYSMADAEGLAVTSAGSTFRWRGVPVRLRLGGRFNVTNALCAAAMAECLGVGPKAVAEGLGAVASVPGRFEVIDAGQPFTVVVDYAHTPDSLDQLLQAAREAVAPGGRLVVVFGAGGDRDRAKRPLMGAVAAARADEVIVTTDNPRDEDPAAIIDDVMAGVTGPAQVVPDRAGAIAAAVGQGRAGDVVVIAGKGHETGQTMAGRTVPFDDRVVARRVLEGMGTRP